MSTCNNSPPKRVCSAGGAACGGPHINRLGKVRLVHCLGGARSCKRRQCGGGSVVVADPKVECGGGSAALQW
jgi:hypothetical protein